jgi:antitoxin VapB
MKTTTAKKKRTLAEPGTAKLFKSGRSQAVRLPKEFRFEGNEVRIRRHGLGVLLEPSQAGAKIDMKAVFEAMDRIGVEFPEREPQPPEQERDPIE